MKTRFRTISLRFLSLLLLFGVTPLVPAQAYFAAEQAADAAVRAAELELSVGLSESTGRLGAIRSAFTSEFGLEQTAQSVESEVTFTTTTSGDSDFCSSLTLLLDTGTDSQLGAVDSFSFGPIAGTSTLQVVDVRFVVPDTALSGVPHGAGCAVTLAVDGSQVGSATGFSDSRTLTWQLVAEQVVLNEVLADPATGQVEFIELANVGSTDVDVAGWTITELTGSGATTSHDIVATSSAASDLIAHDDSGSTIVPAGGQLALKFAGNAPYLNNDGDTITLLDGSATMLDSYTYTTSLEGKSDARIPDGTGAWIDPIPTPGAPNRAETSLSDLSIDLSSTSSAAEKSVPKPTTDAGSGGGSNAFNDTTPNGTTTATSSVDTAVVPSASSSEDAVDPPVATSSNASGTESTSTPLPTPSATTATTTEESLAPPASTTNPDPTSVASDPVGETAPEESSEVEPPAANKPKESEESLLSSEAIPPPEPEPDTEPETEESQQKDEEFELEVTAETEAI